jgi:hypothetical protein
MTQEEIPEQAIDDAVSQTQVDMDRDQGLQNGTTPEMLTRVEVEQMLAEQARVYQGQIAGLQSKVDTGLNAVRRDTQTWAQQQMGDLQTRLGRESWLNSLDEDQRSLVTPLVQQMDRMQPAPAPLPDSAPTAYSDAGMLDTQMDFVIQGFGLQPNDVRINKAALRAGDQQGFMQSIRSAIAADTTAQPPQPRQQSAPQAVNPPVEGRGQSSNNGTDSIMNQHIRGEISIEEYKRRMSEQGVQV